jgi:hypothetical protein
MAAFGGGAERMCFHFYTCFQLSTAQDLYQVVAGDQAVLRMVAMSITFTPVLSAKA